jgi:hypothetical protein
MVEVPPTSQEGLSWTLRWLEATLSGQSEIINVDALASLHRELLDRSVQDALVGTSAANAAASIAVELFCVLTARVTPGRGANV